MSKIFVYAAIVVILLSTVANGQLSRSKKFIWSTDTMLIDSLKARTSVMSGDVSIGGDLTVTDDVTIDSLDARAIVTSEDVSIGGNAGFGTASPSARIHAVGLIKGDSLRLDNYAAIDSMCLATENYSSAGDGSRYSQLFSKTGTNSGRKWSTLLYDTDLLYYDSSSARVCLKQGGNVGIGTITPAAKLHVNGTVIISDPSATGEPIMQFRQSTTDRNYIQYRNAGYTEHYGKSVFTGGVLQGDSLIMGNYASVDSLFSTKGVTSSAGIKGTTGTYSGTVSVDSLFSTKGIRTNRIVADSISVGSGWFKIDSGSVACTLTVAGTGTGTWDASHKDTIGVLYYQKVGRQVTICLTGFDAWLTIGTGFSAGFKILNYPTAIIPNEVSHVKYSVPAASYFLASQAASDATWNLVFHVVGNDIAAVESSGDAIGYFSDFTATYYYR